MRKESLNRLPLLASLSLCLIGCRATSPVFSDLPGVTAMTECGPRIEIIGARPGAYSGEIEKALISALHRAHGSASGTWEADLRRNASLLTTSILNGVKVTLTMPDMSPEGFHLALQDLGDGGLFVSPWSLVYYVHGEVRCPVRESYVGSRVTLLKAIEAAGGFTESANRKKVQLIRCSQTYLVDCIKAQKHPSLDMEVIPGDSVFVPPKLQ